MTIFNHIYDHTDIMFYSSFIGMTCLLTGSFIKSYLFKTNIQTIIETPTLDSGINTIRELSNLEVSPTLHHLTAGNLRYLQNILDSKTDIGIQTVETYDHMHNDVGIQTSEVLTKLEQGIQTMKESNVTTGDLINLLESPISPSRLNKFNLELDLSLVNNPLEINPNELAQMELLTNGVDLSIIEAYIPVPELVMCG